MGFQFFLKNFYLILGQVLHLFLLVFAMPFLILSSFQFLAASDILGNVVLVQIMLNCGKMLIRWSSRIMNCVSHPVFSPLPLK